MFYECVLRSYGCVFHDKIVHFIQVIIVCRRVYLLLQINGVFLSCTQINMQQVNLEIS